MNVRLSSLLNQLIALISKKIQSSLDQWRLVFLITFGVAIIRIIIYSIWGSAEIQPFNNPEITIPVESAMLTEQLMKKSVNESNV